MPDRLLQPDDSNRSFDGGRVLMGGSPLRIMRLSETGAKWADRWFGGEPAPTDGPTAAMADRLIDRGLAHPTYDTSPFTSADVTAVIPVKDDPNGVAATVASLSVGQIIVVDDGSANPLDETLLGPTTASVTVLRISDSSGPASARNLGLAKVTTPLVLFIDADVVPTPGWLEPLLPHFSDNRLVAVAPRVASAPGPSPLDQYEQRHSPLDLGPQPGPVVLRSRLSYVPTACLICRTDRLIDQDPCFDPSLRYGEDVDLIWRLLDDGDRVRYEPASVVHHRPRPSITELMKQRFGYGSAAAPLAQRHPKAVPPLVASSWSVAAIVLAALGWFKTAAVIAAFGTASLKPKLSSLPNPGRRAVEISAYGNSAVAGQFASSVVRTWWPIALVAAVVSRRARRAVALAAIGPAIIQTVKQRDPAHLRELPLRLLDDVSYCAGVWRGCVDHRTIEPLLPDLTTWRP